MVEKELRSYTWRELETNGKFAKNDKLSFITDDMLIVGCDIGSENHYIRAIDVRGRELSRGAFEFSNTSEGFENAKAWVLALAAKHDKKQIVLGLEPTGHYWFALAAWMISNGISVVQGNPYAVKQSKEIEDNSQLKDDRKRSETDRKSCERWKLRNALSSRKSLRRHEKTLHVQGSAYRRQDKKYQSSSPGIENLFSRIHGRIWKNRWGIYSASTESISYPIGYHSTGSRRHKNIWHNEKLRGRGYSRANEIVSYAEKSVGLTDGTDAGREAVKWYAEQILKLVACSSGKHKGQTKISHRGRKRLRYWLFQAAKSAVSHADEFKQLHEYYTTRTNNPLKKMQSLVVIACKILRVIYTILKTGTTYDPQKLLEDIKRPTASHAPMAA